MGSLEKRVLELEAEVANLRLRLLSAAGDDLCRLTQEEIKVYTSGAVQIPPRSEFIPSCERFHAQLEAGPGVLAGCLTMAQLIAENETLKVRERVAGARLFVEVGKLESANQSHPYVHFVRNAVDFEDYAGKRVYIHLEE